MSVIVKITVKFPVCSKPKTHAYGVFDCDFDFDSHEWSCSHTLPIRTLPILPKKPQFDRNYDMPEVAVVRYARFARFFESGLIVHLLGRLEAN